MTITKTIDGTKMYAAIEGRLDTVTTSQAEQELRDGLDAVTELTLDFKQLNYISSAGLRLLLILQKSLNGRGSMKIINANDVVREIFDVTGFSNILVLE